jgi:hypothetical protein
MAKTQCTYLIYQQPCKSSSGGLEFLGVPRGAVILRTTVAFVEAWAS